MKYNRFGFWMGIREWYKHRGVILNLGLGRTLLQIWLWGIRFTSPPCRPNLWKIHELFIWRPMTREEAIRFGFLKE